MEVIIYGHGLTLLHSLMFKHQCGVLSSLPANLKWAAFGRVKNQEATQDSFTVCRHVERYTVFPSQNTLPQFLRKKTCVKNQIQRINKDVTCVRVYTE